MTLNNEQKTLKPCPFCGGDDPVFGYVDDPDSPDHGGHFIQCPHQLCGASTGLRYACGDDPRPLLAETWNRRTTPPHPARSVDEVERENVRLREALECSVTALDDWLHVYAHDLCGETHVEESRARIGRFGTLGYIADVQFRNRAALAQKETKND